jgi:DNA-binding transcriptional LysR family regulator
VIASTQSLTAGFIPALVGRLEDRVPKFRTRHRLGWMSEVIDSVKGGRATVGFGRYAPLVTGLRQTTLGFEPVVACLAVDHPWVRAVIATPAQLEGLCRSSVPGA